jgi:hypothetical protein
VTLGLVLAGAALVLSGGTVIDGYGNAPIPDGIVVIEGDRILRGYAAAVLRSS